VATADAGSVVDRLAATIALLAPGLGSAHVQIGVSDAVGEAEAVLAAVAEARAVAATASPSPAVAGPDRLASSALLLAAVPAELRAGYVDRVLGPLLGHDRMHRTDLVGTLRNYLDCSGSWSRCAERMHLHVNTLRYRVERIQALTGRDLRRLDDQIDLLLAVRLLDAP
jgi:DNA-binding PucR family transcriptional regulator